MTIQMPPRKAAQREIQGWSTRLPVSHTTAHPNSHTADTTHISATLGLETYTWQLCAPHVHTIPCRLLLPPALRSHKQLHKRSFAPQRPSASDPPAANICVPKRSQQRLNTSCVHNTPPNGICIPRAHTSSCTNAPLHPNSSGPPAATTRVPERSQQCVHTAGVTLSERRTSNHPGSACELSSTFTSTRRSRRLSSGGISKMSTRFPLMYRRSKKSRLEWPTPRRCPC